MATPGSPHPLLRDSVLYLADPPKRVKWQHIVEAFSSCGTVASAGKSPVLGQPNRKKWVIRFPSIYQAEMALATLQGAALKVNPPYQMTLSHLPTLQTALPAHRLFPQFVKVNNGPGHIGEPVSSQTLFTWFRSAGPLVSVRQDVNVGYSQTAIVLEYWDEKHADFARLKKNALHEELQSRPAFTLRTYDPCNLYYAGFGATFVAKDITAEFSKFGPVKETTMHKAGFPDAYGFISFLSANNAATALHAMSGKVMRSGAAPVTVRYHEPNAQQKFRSPSSPYCKYQNTESGTPEPQPPNTDPGPPPSATADKTDKDQQQKEAAARAKKAAEEREAKAAAERELKEAAERKAKEAAAREAAEAKLKQKDARHEERRARKEAAMRAESMARKNREGAVIDETNAKKAHTTAQELLQMADSELLSALQACAEAKRVLMEAMDRQTRAERQVNDARINVGSAKQRMQQAAAGRKIAEQVEKSYQTAREAIEKEEAQDAIDEETLRLAELAESIRRMEELRKIEQQEKEEKEKKKREAKTAEQERLKRQKEAQQREEAARIAREKEEAERAKRESREREEKEKRDAENRLRLYHQAVEMERRRCRQRDLQFCPAWNVKLWFNSHALKRFVAVSAEFDTLRYNESQPLTFESIPWPVLHHPHDMTLEVIEWTLVEKFFASVKDTMKQAEYRALLEKARLRFHPDRWKSRGILRSVLDEDLRSQLEVAGNVVSQAINSLRSKE